MLKKKCTGCAKSVERKFNFCPYCGMSFKLQKEKEDYGMIGRDDVANLGRQFKQEIKLPFGLDKMINQMIKQLNKELTNINPNISGQQGFKIQISTGKPVNKAMQDNNQQKQTKRHIEIPIEEMERRQGLPREEAESNIRRLPDRIIYEIEAPGVKSNNDIVITKLENSMEIKAYSKDRCFYKIIPLKVEVMRYYIKDNRLFLELKS